MIIADNVILIEKNKKLRETHEQAVRNSNVSYINELKLKLDEKDVKILKLVHLLKIVTTEHISKIIYKGSKYADKYTQNKMRKLFGYGCVDKFTPRPLIGEGSSQNHYVLARPGAKFLEIKNFRPIKKLNQKWRHTVAISDIFVGIASKYEIIDWAPEIKLNYNIGSKEYEVRPDCFVQWRVNGKDNFAFFEADLGSENQQILNKKIDNYHKYFFESDDFKSHSWQPFDKPVILPIIFVLNDKERKQRLNNYYTRFINKHSSQLNCYFTTFDNII